MSGYCELKIAVLKPVLMGVSSVCLIFVWFVYILVAKLRSFNEGRCILSLVSALFVAHVTFIILNFMTGANESPFCVVTGEWYFREATGVQWNSYKRCINIPSCSLHHETSVEAYDTRCSSHYVTICKL